MFSPNVAWTNAGPNWPGRSAIIISTVHSTIFSSASRGSRGADLREFVATGADDEAVGKWIAEHATKRPRIEIIKWNNEWRYKRMSEAPDQLQEFMEDYIPANVPGAVIHHIRYLFDVFDAEEKRFVH